MSISKIRLTALTVLTALTAIAFLALPVPAQEPGGGAQTVAAEPAKVALPAPAQGQSVGAQTAAAEPAKAAPAQGQTGEGGGLPPPQGGLFGGNFLFIMAAMFAIIYFFMIRPEQRKQKERQKMLSALKKGDRVLTIGGLVGVITVVKDSTYIVKSGEGAVFEVTKSAISSQINDAKESREALTAETSTPDAKENK